MTIDQQNAYILETLIQCIGADSIEICEDNILIQFVEGSCYLSRDNDLMENFRSLAIQILNESYRQEQR